MLSSLTRRLSALLVLTVTTLLASNLAAESFSSNNYDVYIGDVNGDGIDDLYFKSKQGIVPIHAEIVIPIVTQGGDSYVMHGAGDYFHDPFVKNNVNLNGLRLAAGVQFYDYNSDGNTDVIVSQQSGVPYAIALLGGNTPQVVADIGGNDASLISQSPFPYAAAKDKVSVANTKASDRLSAISGEFRVSESGAATYSIPIYTPPGTAGVAPKIALNYSSSGGNGLLGMGWSISGLSAISRCRQTLAIDGAAKPITWSASDRFCLDGQRLLLISGVYGSAGSTYKTEIDTFAEVKAHGGSAGDPSYFSVKRKDGSISFYGNSVSSSMDNNKNSKTLTWAINRFQDSVGNKIVYNYAKSTHSQRVSSILYGTSTVNHSSLIFQYSDRKVDYQTSYTAGFKTESKKRLTGIQSKVGSKVVRQYTVNYDIKNTQFSRVIGITECSDSSRTVCRGATKFDWQYPLVGFSDKKVSAGSVNHEQMDSYKPLDVNGDGMMDIAYLRTVGKGNPDYIFEYGIAKNGTIEVRDPWFNNSNSNDLKYDESKNQGELVKFEVVDYNADGRSDVLIYNQRNSNPWRLFLSEPTQNGWELKDNGRIFPFKEKNTYFADLNSDGLVDAYTLKGNKLSVYYLEKNPNSSFNSNQYYHYKLKYTLDTTGLSLPDPVNPPVDGMRLLETRLEILGGVVGDFNRDGIVDFGFKIEQDYIYWLDCNGCTVNPPRLHKNYGVLLATVQTNTNQEKRLETIPGMTLITSDYLENHNFLSERTSVADLNADGYPELLFLYESWSTSKTGRWVYHMNDGLSFDDGTDLVVFNNRNVAKSVQMVDVTADGYADFVWHDSSAGKLKVNHWKPNTNSFTGEKPIFQYAVNLTNINYTYDKDVAYQSAASAISSSFAASDKSTDTYTLMDLQGNGALDVLHFSTKTNDKKLYIYKNKQTKTAQHAVRKITNGLGAVTEITYEPMAQSTHYSRLRTLEENCQQTGCSNSDDTFLSKNQFYTALNNPFSDVTNVYPKTKTYPVLMMDSGRNLVTKVYSSSPTASNTNAKAGVAYYYKNSRIQAAGRGDLGFEELATYDYQTEVLTKTSYRQDFPYLGRPIETQTTYKDDVVSKSTNTWNRKLVSGSHQPYLQVAEDIKYQINSSVTGLSLKTYVYSKTKTQNTYDNYGNPTTIKVVTTGGNQSYAITTTNTYGSSVESQKLGRLSKTKVVHNRSSHSGPSIVRESEFKYFGFGCPVSNNNRGLLCSEITNSNRDSSGNLGSYALQKTYSYDAFGNAIKTESKDLKTGQTRVSHATYASNGRYADTTTNHYGQKISDAAGWDSYGNPATVTDLNGVVTSLRYTPMGEKYLEHSRLGEYSYSYRRKASAICPAGSAYEVYSSTGTGNISLTCHDKLAREVLSRSKLIDGTWTNVVTEYDILGRISRQSEPDKSYKPAYWNKFTYDALGNVIAVDAPNYNGNSRVSKTEYNGFWVNETNPKGHVRKEKKDAFGNVQQIIDPIGGKVVYHYNHIGDLVKTETTANKRTYAITMKYDSFGHKTEMSDPDKGTWRYTKYNAFGELLEQVNARGDTVSTTYDRLGRMIKRVEVDGRAEWVYNNTNSGNSRGSIQYEIQFNSNNQAVYRVDYTYDGYGRSSETRTTIDGLVYKQKVSYDNYGRIQKSQDAAGNNNVIKNIYKNGFTQQVVNAENGNQVYYHAISMDARGNITKYKQGPITVDKNFDKNTGFLRTIKSSVLGLRIQDQSYSWDELGNLKDRTDRSGDKDIYENFVYDGLNRLKEAKVAGKPKQFTYYDGHGNITSKTGVGSYQYGSNCSKPAGPHAVCKITGNGKTETFDYDKNGNMTTHKVNGVNERRFTYASFDKPTRIVLRNSEHTTQFSYGTMHNRYKRTDTNADGTTTTYYLGSVEKVVKPSGKVEYRRYIGDTLITHEFGSSNNYQRSVVRHILKDHLGSTDVIADADGKVSQMQSFDAWGMRRDPGAKISLTPVGLLDLADVNNEFTTKGFTGHEAVDQVGVIHMNGRIYDARIARFLQADLQVDGVTNTQGFNRYSYGHNNPLNGTDPSGYGFFKEVFDDILGITESPILNGIAQVAACYFGGPWGCAAYATASAKGQGASWGDALQAGAIAGVSAFAFQQIGAYFSDASAANLAAGPPNPAELVKFGGNWLTPGQVAGQIGAHAITGGIVAELQGGKFGHGFISAGVTKGVMAGAGFNYGNRDFSAIAGRTVAASIVGGTASRLTGGKFSNGAMTAAFAHLMNAERVESLNQWKIIKREIVDWWAGSETEDLRNGIQASLDVATIPYKTVMLASDAHTVIEMGVAAKSGAYGDAAIMGSSLLVGEGATKFIKQIGVKNEYIQNAGSLGASKAAEKLLGQDCFTCTKYE